MRPKTSFPFPAELGGSGVGGRAERVGRVEVTVLANVGGCGAEHAAIRERQDQGADRFSRRIRLNIESSICCRGISM